MGDKTPWSTWDGLQNSWSSLNISEIYYCSCFTYDHGDRFISSLQPAYCYFVCRHTVDINWYLPPAKYTEVHVKFCNIYLIFIKGFDDGDGDDDDYNDNDIWGDFATGKKVHKKKSQKQKQRKKKVFLYI